MDGGGQAGTGPGGAIGRDDALTAIDPDHEKLVRLKLAIVALLAMAAAAAAYVEAGRSGALAGGTLVVLALLAAWYLPHRRYLAHGYAIGPDRLRVVRGLLFRSDIVVPFGRVQHIDVDRGPLQRAFGLATLTLYTAGSQNASVALPGLAHERALAMREDVRAHIKRETA